MKLFYGLALTLACLSLTPAQADAQAAKAFALDVTAVDQQSPPKITLHWTHDPSASVYIVRRRIYGETAWGPEKFVDVPAVQYADEDVEPGVIYEYRVNALTNKTTYGFVTAGIKVPARASEGFVLLLVGSSAAATSAANLDIYIDDLVRLGWNVEMQVIDESLTPPQVKDKIIEAYSRHGTHLRSVFLFGRIPVSYSGNIAPDGHVEDKGAWPADVYYGDMDGDWTDESVNTTIATRPENDNIPGDGKFDQSTIPSGDVELAVGRVDFRKMGWFYPDVATADEREALLLNDYLEKLHEWRMELITTNNKGIVSDLLGELGPTDVPAAIAWRGFPALTTEIEPTSEWMNKLTQETYHWAYGAGTGDYFVVSGVGTTEEYSKRDPRAVFTMMFSSRSGDWYSNDNILRAPLGTSTGLASIWAGRPYWYIHQMGIGMTIGEATRHSQSATASYITTEDDATVHMALMGDPTLRNDESSTNAVPTLTYSNGSIEWPAASVAGYFVSRGPSAKGPFVPLSQELLSTNSFTDPSPNPNEPYYLVRPVEVCYSESGSYLYASRGAIINILGSVQQEQKANALMSMRGDVIRIDETGIQGTLTVIDVLGRTILEHSVTGAERIDVSSLTNGAYIAKLVTASGVETLRFNL